MFLFYRRLLRRLEEAEKAASENKVAIEKLAAERNELCSWLKELESQADNAAAALKKSTAADRKAQDAELN